MEQIIHFRSFAESDHHGIDFLLREDIVQCFLITACQAAAAKGFHGKYPFPCSMAGFDGFHHFFLCGKLVAFADAQTCIVDEGEDHIQFGDFCCRHGDIHMVGGKTDGTN